MEYIKCAACAQPKPRYGKNLAMCRECYEMLTTRQYRNMDLYHLSPNPVAWSTQVKRTVRKAHEDIFRCKKD